MSQLDSILDKVMENKQAEELSQFDPQTVISALFSQLSEREQEVLMRRFGLKGADAQTLEVIGQHFGVTRERVRQIETGSIKKLRKYEKLSEELRHVQAIIHQVLDQHGGILQEDHLLDEVLSHREESSVDRSILIFLIEKLLADHFDLFSQPDRYHRGWKLVTADHASIHALAEKLVATVEAFGKPIEEEKLVEQVLQSAQSSEANENIVRGHLRLCKNLKQNIFGHWGKSDWNSITPKRMNDKIFLVLQHVKKPLHFTEIAEQINALKFDHKTAYPATVHNELILDEKYVLVGRGIYALSEWGYKPGVVADVIINVLKEAEKPLTREEIVERVLEQRIVGKSTIHLALMNKNRFSRLADGKYMLQA